MTSPRGALAVLVVLAALAGGCGSNGTASRRDAVNAYFGRVKTAQIELLGSSGQIDTTLAGFSLSRSTPGEMRRLRQARATVDRAVRRMRALEPPPDALHLHELLVQRLLLQRDVIDDLILTAAAIPKLAATAVPLRAAATTLQRELAAIAATAPAASPPPAASPGAQVFASAGCAGCHTLAAAGASGSVGPNLDALRPDAAAVAAQVRSGGGGMPSFGGRLTDAQIAAVASYVATEAGKTTVRPGSASSLLGRYATAFGDYGDALRPVAAALTRIPPSSILEPGIDAERRAVTRSIALCAAIRRALEGNDVAAANAAIHSLLTVASTTVGTTETRRAQAAAAKAYDARLRAIDRFATRINLERNRLVRLVG